VPLVSLPFASSGDAEWLARVASADDINRLQVVCADISHVGEPLRVRPMLRQHVAAERIVFHLPHGMPHARPFEAEFETADTAEEATDSHTQHYTRSLYLSSPNLAQVRRQARGRGCCAM
jgi:hypothetical protein